MNRHITSVLQFVLRQETKHYVFICDGRYQRGYKVSPLYRTEMKHCACDLFYIFHEFGSFPSHLRAVQQPWLIRIPVHRVYIVTKSSIACTRSKTVV